MTHLASSNSTTDQNFRFLASADFFDFVKIERLAPIIFCSEIVTFIKMSEAGQLGILDQQVVEICLDNQFCFMEKSHQHSPTAM